MLIPVLLSILQDPVPPPSAAPSVLIVVADDLSDRDIDRIDTPTFDALAADGLRFRRAYSMPTCSPSRWAIHFGRYHTQDAGPVCDGYGDPPSIAALSLPDLFHAAGYHTGLFGKWHLGSHPAVQQGEPWEETPRLHGYDTWRAGLPANVNSCGGSGVYSWLRVDDGRSSLSTDYVNDAIRDAFLKWYAELEPGRPWFAMVSFQAPHLPRHLPPGMPPEETKPSAKGPRRLYEAQVRYLDRALGEILAAINRERTLVVFLADNGAPKHSPSWYENPQEGKKTTFEDGIRVPMVWAGQGVPAGVETHALVHLVDLLPTFAELIGADIGETELDGTSLLPLMTSQGSEVREYVWSGLGAPESGEFAVVTSRYKLRRTPDGLQLYDLVEDPDENENLVTLEEQEGLVADLKRKLELHLDQMFGVPEEPPREVK